MAPSNENNFYHVTSIRALHQILASTGIDPNRATGRRKWAWYVQRERVSWAIAHVMHKHGLILPEVVVCKVRSNRKVMRHTHLEGFFSCTRVYMPVSYESAAEWLMKEERQIAKIEKVMSDDDWYKPLREEG